jgi:hypothetical protein
MKWGFSCVELLTFRHPMLLASRRDERFRVRSVKCDSVPHFTLDREVPTIPHHRFVAELKRDDVV